MPPKEVAAGQRKKGPAGVSNKVGLRRLKGLTGVVNNLKIVKPKWHPTLANFC